MTARRVGLRDTTVDPAGMLPSWQVTCAIVRTCGADTNQWKQRWREARGAGRQRTKAPTGGADRAGAPFADYLQDSTDGLSPDPALAQTPTTLGPPTLMGWWASSALSSAPRDAGPHRHPFHGGLEPP